MSRSLSIFIKRFFLGTRYLHYPCPHCSSPVEADFRASGDLLECKLCDTFHQIPSREWVASYQALLAKKERQAAESRRKVAEAKQARVNEARADWQRKIFLDAQAIAEERQRVADAEEETARISIERQFKDKKKKEREAEEWRLAEEERRRVAEILLRERQDRESFENYLAQARLQGIWFVIYKERAYQWQQNLQEWQESPDKVTLALREAIDGHHTYVQIAGRYYIYIAAYGGWRLPSPYERKCIEHAKLRGGRPWFEGPIVSRNLGSIIVPPFIKSDGTPVNGHTKNRPGEGPAKPRLRSIRIEDPERHGAGM